MKEAILEDGMHEYRDEEYAEDRYRDENLLIVAHGAGPWSLDARRGA